MKVLESVLRNEWLVCIFVTLYRVMWRNMGIWKLSFRFHRKPDTFLGLWSIVIAFIIIIIYIIFKNCFSNEDA